MIVSLIVTETENKLDPISYCKFLFVENIFKCWQNILPCRRLVFKFEKYTKAFFLARDGNMTTIEGSPALNDANGRDRSSN